MKSYHQSDLFQLLISAALSTDLHPDAQMLAAYKKRRLNTARRALLARNLFLYTSGYRDPLLDLSASGPTVYTQPAGQRLLLLGYANNFRYGATIQNNTAAVPPGTQQRIFPQMHRLRIPGRSEAIFCEDLTAGQSGIAGEPRYTDVRLTAPTIIEPDEQIAIDLGYDPLSGSAPVNVPPEAFIIFALKIKTELSAEDKVIFADCQRYIKNNDFQRGIYLNALSATQQPIRFSAPGVGAAATAETRPVSNPVLITAIGTNMGAATIKITDTGDGSSLSLHKPMQSSALNFPNYENLGRTNIASMGGPCWSNYFRLPFPHLLRSGSQLKVDLVSGGDDGDGAGAPNVPELQQGDVLGRPGPVLMFQAITV